MIYLEWISISSIILQTGLLSFVVWLLSLHKNSSPRMMYLLWYLIILRHVFPFNLEIIHKSVPEIFSTAIPSITTLSIHVSSTSGMNLARIFKMIWILGVIFLTLYVVINEYVFRKHLKLYPITEELLTYLPMAFHKIKIYSSPSVNTPLSYGIFRSIIIIPQSVLNLPVQQLHSILAHECEHIRRRDPLHNVFQQIFCIVWFWNPFVWIAKRQCDYYREILCDTHSLNRTNITPVDYSTLLLSIVNERWTSHSLKGTALTKIDGNFVNLRKRIIYLNTYYQLGERTMLKRTQKIVVTLFIVIIFLGACKVNNGQLQHVPREENTAIVQKTNVNNDEEVTFVPYDVPPSPIGGFETIINQIDYPKEDIKGIVIVQAFVNEQGNVSTCKILKGINEEFDEAAMKAVQNTTFSPAKKDDKEVGVWISVPIEFR